MPKLKILVADDDPNSSKPLFDRLLTDNDEFDPLYAETWQDFAASDFRSFAAVLLDVNLQKWGRSLSDALGLIGDITPVVLVSRWWRRADTHRHVAEALAANKGTVLAGTLALEVLEAPGWEEVAHSMRQQLRFVFERFRSQSALHLDDGDPIRILHLSDPQYGDPKTENVSLTVEEEIADYIEKRLKVHVHLIAITGDIGYSGQPWEYKRASERLESLVARIIPNREDWRERVLIVPGNHDVNLRLAAADLVTYSFGRTQRADINQASSDTTLGKYALQPFHDFLSQFTMDTRVRESSNLFWINDSFLHLGIRLLLPNSVSEVSALLPQKYTIPEAAIKKMSNEARRADSVFTILMSHHGPATKGSGNECVQNWAQTSKLFQIIGAGMLLHGHGHERKCEIIKLDGAGVCRDASGSLESGEAIRVMAPTTHLNGELRPPKETRGFNIITLGRRHGRVDSVEVKMYELDGDEPHLSAAGTKKVEVSL